MQTFSHMSRNSIIKNLLKNLAFLLFYVFYITLSSIDTILPPLLGVLFAKYIQDTKQRNLIGLFCVFVCTLFFEVEKSSLLGVLFLLFVFLFYLVHRLKLVLHEEGYFFNLIYVFLPYVFYFFFLQAFSVLSGHRPISIDFVIFWYFFAESVIILWKR